MEMPQNRELVWCTVFVVGLTISWIYYRLFKGAGKNEERN